MWLDRRAQPGLESITFRLQSHGLQDGLGEERVPSNEADDPEQEKKAAETEGDPATVSSRFFVVTA